MRLKNLSSKTSSTPVHLNNLSMKHLNDPANDYVAFENMVTGEIFSVDKPAALIRRLSFLEKSTLKDRRADVYNKSRDIANLSESLQRPEVVKMPP